MLAAIGFIVLIFVVWRLIQLAAIGREAVNREYLSMKEGKTIVTERELRKRAENNLRVHHTK